MAAVPKIFNIPASAPFLPVLIDALRRGRLIEGFPASRDPLELARATLYLPTRRACRMARDAFLTELEGHAAILPRIVALGDLDEDEIIFADAATAELAEDTLALPPAIKPLDRRLLLAQLIVRWAAAIRPEQGAPLIANTPAAALALADDLARLIDDVITRKMDWQRLDGLVPDQFDTYWLLPIYARDILSVGPVGLGLLRSAPAVGALITSIVLARHPVERNIGRKMFAVVGIFGVTTIVFGLSNWFPLSLLALAVLGASDAVSIVIRFALVQIETPDEKLGRVSAINYLFVGSSNTLGEFESGLVAAWLGAVPSVVIGGLGSLLVATVWMMLFPDLRRIDRFEPADTEQKRA